MIHNNVTDKNTDNRSSSDYILKGLFLIYIVTQFELLLKYKLSDRSEKNRTEEKTKILSVRVSETLFNRLKQKSDEQEISLAEHVRNIIENEEG